MWISDETTDSEARLARTTALEARQVNPYLHEFGRNCSLHDVRTAYADVKEAGEEVNLNLYGRVTSIQQNDMQLMIEIQDRDARLTLLMDPEILPQRTFTDFKSSVFIGDWVGFRLKWIYRGAMAELTGQVGSWQILTASLRPPVNDDKDDRRAPYLSLATDPTARRQLVARAAIVRDMRRFLEDRYGFLEVNAASGSVGADSVFPPASDSDLRQLIVGGMEAVYQVNHRPSPPQAGLPAYQQQSIDCYLAPADFGDMILLVEHLITVLAAQAQTRRRIDLTADKAMSNFDHFYCKGVSNAVTDFGSGTKWHTDFASNAVQHWPRRSVYALTQEVTGEDLLAVTSINEAVTIARSLGLAVQEDMFGSVGGVAVYIVRKLVYPTLVQRTFVVDFPIEEYPLIKRHRHDSRLVERGELVINGLKLASANTALTDPRELQRLARQDATWPDERQSCAYADSQFVDALMYGLPPTGTLKIRVDSLVDFLTGDYWLKT